MTCESSQASVTGPMQEGGLRPQIPGDEGRITCAQSERDCVLAELTTRLVSGA